MTVVPSQLLPRPPTPPPGSYRAAALPVFCRSADISVVPSYYTPRTFVSLGAIPRRISAISPRHGKPSPLLPDCRMTNQHVLDRDARRCLIGIAVFLIDAVILMADRASYSAQTPQPPRARIWSFTARTLSRCRTRAVEVAEYESCRSAEDEDGRRSGAVERADRQRPIYSAMHRDLRMVSDSDAELPIAGTATART